MHEYLKKREKKKKLKILKGLFQRRIEQFVLRIHLP